MKTVVRLVATQLFAAISILAQLPGMPQPKYPWSDTSMSPDQRADLVIQEMTLDEKISMLHGQGMPFLTSATPESNGGAGYTNAIPRLGIPAIQMADSAYGVTRGAAAGRYSTALPSNLGAASSWDPEIAFQYGSLVGRELRDEGYSMSLGGGVNLAREPRNGRTFEYFGEDPLLAGTLAGNLVKGVQSFHVIGDLKHFAVNDQESGRVALDANIDKRAMWETDLRAFEIAVRISDPGAIMCSYNRVNGDFACENGYLLSDTLKRRFAFKGFVLSDWGATHSAAKASHAGLDMEQPDQNFFGAALKGALKNGEVTEEEINDHVHRILRTMFATGLFDYPIERRVPDVENGASLAQRIAEKSIILLKNRDHVLPLPADARSIVLIGGHADVGVLSGGGSAQVDAPGGSPVPPPPAKNMLDLLIHPQWMPSSPLRFLREKLPSVAISYFSGEDLASVVSAARSADFAIVFAYQWEAEASDLPTLDLAADQNKLIETVAAVNPRTIVVIESGGPTTMPWIEHVAGVVEAWYPGIRGGQALAGILSGSVNPTGKLAITFPLSDADLPHSKIVEPPSESQQHFDGSPQDLAKEMARAAKGLPPFEIRYDEGLKVGYAWYDAEKRSVLFPFGFGLSYTSYEYSGLHVIQGEPSTVSFTVKNNGQRSGTEIAQVYASLPPSVGEPPKRLIGWTRVELAPGQSKQVSISIPRDCLTVYSEDSNSWELTRGNYVVTAGGSSRDLPLKQNVVF